VAWPLEVATLHSANNGQMVSPAGVLVQ